MADNNGWHVAENGASIGPMSLEDLVARVSRGGPHAAQAAMIYGPGMTSWSAAGQVPPVAQRLRAAPPGGGGYGVPPPPSGRPRADVIDYEIFGNEMQYA